MIYTKYLRPEGRISAERIDDTLMVDTDGFISKKKRIEMLTQAGERLVLARKEMFHFEDENVIDENFIDPTIDRGYTYFDAFEDLEIINDKVVEMQKRLDRRKKNDKKKPKVTINKKPDTMSGDEENSRENGSENS